MSWEVLVHWHALTALIFFPILVVILSTLTRRGGKKKKPEAEELCWKICTFCKPYTVTTRQIRCTGCGELTCEHCGRCGCPVRQYFRCRSSSSSAAPM